MPVDGTALNDVLSTCSNMGSGTTLWYVPPKAKSQDESAHALQLAQVSGGHVRCVLQRAIHVGAVQRRVVRHQLVERYGKRRQRRELSGRRAKHVCATSNA